MISPGLIPEGTWVCLFQNYLFSEWYFDFFERPILLFSRVVILNCEVEWVGWGLHFLAMYWHGGKVKSYRCVMWQCWPPEDSQYLLLSSFCPLCCSKHGCWRCLINTVHVGWIMLEVGGIWFHFCKGFSLLLLFSIYMYEDLLGIGTWHSWSFLGLEQQTLPKK